MTDQMQESNNKSISQPNKSISQRSGKSNAFLSISGQQDPLHSSNIFYQDRDFNFTHIDAVQSQDAKQIIQLTSVKQANEIFKNTLMKSYMLKSVESFNEGGELKFRLMFQKMQAYTIEVSLGVVSKLPELNKEILSWYAKK